MIESLEGFMNLDKILQLKEVNILFIGPKDLENSLKKTGYKKSINFVINQIKSKIINKKKICGIHQVDPNLVELKKKIKENFKFIAYSTDAQFLIKGFQGVKKEI